MNEMPADELKKIESHLMDGRYDEARLLLASYLRHHPDSAQAWFLLSFAVPETGRQIECLDRALKIDPWFSKARLRLAQFSSATPPPVTTSPATPPPDTLSPASPSPVTPGYASSEIETNPNPKVAPFYEDDMIFEEKFQEDQPQEKSWFEELQAAYPPEPPTASLKTPLTSAPPGGPGGASQAEQQSPSTAPDMEPQPAQLPDAENLENVPLPETQVESNMGLSRDQKIWLWVGVVFFLLIISSFGILYLGTLFVLPTPPPTLAVVLPSLTPPPTFTPTETPTVTQTPIFTRTMTPLPTSTPLPAAALVSPRATIVFQMQVIQ